MSTEPETFRAEVQRYRDRGWQVVRLRPGGKMAYEKDWPNLIREADDFQPGENVGVRFGPQSGGLVDVDLDYDTARRLVACPAFGLDHLVEFGRSSLPAGRRGHRLVVVPDAPNRSRVLGLRSKRAVELLRPRGIGLTVVELRASNGSQTAFPPSVIRTEGKPDDPLVWSDPDATIPELGWTELNHRVGRLAFCALAAALYPEDADDRDPFCLAVFGALIASGVDLDAADLMVAEVARVAGDDTARSIAFDHGGEGIEEFLALAGLQEIGHTVRSWLGLQVAEPDRNDADRERERHDSGDVSSGVIDAETLRRLLDPLDPEDFADYDSHRAMLHAAHHATGGDKAARQVFVDWCARSEAYGPGKRDEHGKLWSEVVGAMWDRSSIDRDGAAPLNTIGTILGHLRDAGHGLLVAQVRREIGSASDDFSDDDLDPQWAETEQSDPSRPHPFKRFSVDDLLDLPDPVWIADGLLLERSLVMLYGPPKSFKTFLGLTLALCIATGRDFHDVPVVRGRVTYVAAEGHAAETRDRVLAWCHENKVAPSELRGWFDLVVSGVRLDRPESVKEFLKVDPSPRTVVFFDTLNRNMEGHESDTQDMTRVVAGCDRVRRALQTMVVVVHHTGVEQGRARGSTVLIGAVDTSLRVSRTKTRVTLKIEAQRAGPDDLSWHFETVAGFAGNDADGVIRDSVVLRPTDAPPSKGGEETVTAKQSAEDTMLLRIDGEEPEQYADLVNDAIRGFSKANVYKVRDRLVAAKLVRPGDRPALTRAGEERVKELLDGDEDED